MQSVRMKRRSRVLTTWTAGLTFIVAGVAFAELHRKDSTSPTSKLGGFTPNGLPVLDATAEDFKEPGTQPLQTDPPEPWMIQETMLPGQDACFLCHAGFEDASTTVMPGRWRGSLHSHAMRDPIFQAAFVIANQTIPGSGETCIRCHSPSAWQEGRATPPTGNPDGSGLNPSDIDEGVSCHACHRMVDHVYQAGVSPPDDELILNVLSANGFLPGNFGNANMVIDPMDVRRGPFADANPPHLFAVSPHHRSGDMCGTCHDVSNPMLSRIGGPIPSTSDSYTFNSFNEQHPTHGKTDMFPEQRTYSEWLLSEYASPGVDTQGRFGGNRTVVSQCQDCHMPAVTGFGCIELFEPPLRNDLPYHSFAGANVTAIDLLLHLYGPNGNNEFDEYTVAALQRSRTDTLYMLDRATDTDLTQFAGELSARTTNHCGHKLLTGMPEGRRIWKNVKFFNGPTLIGEFGAYDEVNATLDPVGTKVYEALLGVDEYMSAQTGEPVGPSFNLIIVNKIFKDNRIPPRGFNNEAFEAVQAGHVDYSYDDGQYWDTTRFCIPAGATRAEVKLYYQTTSREYIEFLRDANTTDNRGQILYDAWAATGKSAPVIMDDVMINLAPFAPGDVTGDGTTSFADISKVLTFWGATGNVGISGGDANCDGVVNFADISYILTFWGSSV